MIHIAVSQSNPEFAVTTQSSRYPRHKSGNLMDGMMKYPTYTWDLVQALESASSVSCKTPATFLDFPSTQTINQEETIIPGKRSNPNKSYHIALAYVHRTPLVWPMYTEPRAKKGRLGTQP